MVHIDQKHQERRSWNFLHSIAWVESPGCCSRQRGGFIPFAGALLFSVGLIMMQFSADAVAQRPTQAENNWTHTFEGNVWPDDGIWNGDVKDFDVVEANLPGALGPNALQLEGNDSGRSTLFRRQKSGFGTWSFIVEQTFVSSSVNRHRVMLFVDDSLTQETINGYGVSTGGSAEERRFILFRLDNGDVQPLLSHPLEAIDGVYRVTVTRDEQFQWSLEVDDLTPTRDPREGSGEKVELIDPTHTEARFFGIRFRYTSTRRTSTTLDDLTFVAGKLPPSVAIDTEVPTVTGLYFGLTTPDTLFIVVSEPLDQTVLRVSGPSSLATASYYRERVWSLPIAQLGDWAPTSDLLRIEQLRDWSGNESANLVAPNPSRYPLPGEIVVTEAMIRPLEDDYDGQPNQSQYLEVYNQTNESLWIPSITFHMGWKEDGEASWKDIQCISCQVIQDFVAHQLPPYSYGLIFPEPKDGPTEVSQTRVAQAHSELPLSIPFWRVDAKTLGFRSTENQLYVAVQFQGRKVHIMDSVRLTEQSHHPLVPTTKGLSLERIASTKAPQPSRTSERPWNYLDGWDPNHWVSSAHPSGGTPGHSNQSHIQQAQSSWESWVRLSPSQFSPNRDGVDDILRIEYELQSPDYLLEATLYTTQGVPIVHLTRGQLAGTRGQLTWNGWMDDGTVVPAGLYILHIRAFGSAQALPKSITRPVGVYR